MLIVSYDITDDKLRTRFSKFLLKFGYRLQYSVYQIKNSKRVLQIIKCEIDSEFAGKFTQSDSVIIFDLSQQCKLHRYGYAANDNDEMIIVD